MNWTSKNISDLNKHVILITGANSGLGFESAKKLSKAGAEIIFACRNEDKALKAINLIKNEINDAKLTYYQLDLMSLNSIKDFSNKILNDYKKLNVLMNNAGIMAIPRKETQDGFEAQFGTNHLGHFALTGHLLPLILKTNNSRIVNVSSIAHTFGQMNWNDINHKNSYNKWPVYGMSKLSNLLFTQALKNKLEEHEHKTIAVSAHPGWTSTNLQLIGPQMAKSKIEYFGAKIANKVFAQDVEMGALPQIFASIDSNIKNGEFYGPNGLFNMRGFPIKVKSMKKARNYVSAEKLWSISENLTKVKYSF
jgi:NAD(P)-dependent dehydrogenase (short-subunit alcohol dehydrogenase family)